MKKSLLNKACLAILFVLIVSSAHSQSASDIILPKPTSVELKSDIISWRNKIAVNEDGANGVMTYITKEFSDVLGVEVVKKSASKADLLLVVDDKSDIASEGYVLDITPEKVVIKASTEAGVFYGVQSLIQMMKNGSKDNVIKMACQKIEDSPRFPWRSYMLDEARHFHGKEAVYQLLDAMARLKMNTFHWHLTDDQGWRIEIKKYPLLTEIGGKRKNTQTGAPFDWHSKGYTDEPHKGFYSQDEIREILAYAKLRHIKVIPEIGMPGHSSAAIASYPWLGTKKVQIEVPIRWQGNLSTLDVIDPRVIEFSQNVLTEVIDLFDTDVLHIGGDEVTFVHWQEDADMIAYKKKKGFASWMDIQVEFTNNISKFIATKNCSMMGWNEILRSSSPETSLATNVVVHFWRGTVEEFTAAALKGYKLVNSTHSETYLDYLYDTTPLSRSYDFNPIPSGLALQYHDNVIGLGCQMWSEFTPTFKDVQRQTFPRLAAYAEVGWSELENKNYQDFLSRLAPIKQEWIDKGFTVGGE